MSSDYLLAEIKKVDDIYALLNTAADWFFAFLLILAVVGILYGAFAYVTAGGDAEKLSQARWIVIGALIGTAIAVLSRTAITVLTSIFA
ncbi:MAG: hypothetical protein Q8R13_00940 [bacterium]|nr:hypothetical protein [bacterium]MDZ4295779.1 hypothetical protein [Patescibacteria group bacterium]